ncbi:homeobox-leucine zipper protein HAT14-like isoform X2 [Impatiens glandulifera]|uniref:homeobox-leucine zipper protein HAT14-like isoform X2 n=1 Tax=Impatiens glandulifera TaxID=253017 RepID=UPI001FB0FABB|nr:homeobox-leucine zipper protein HAT14-like isoform X2 [Impatiens glandulifera]
MELGLTLGDSSIPPCLFTENRNSNLPTTGNHGVGLCMALGINSEKDKLLSLQLNLLPPHSPVHGHSENGGGMNLNMNRREDETEDGFVGISSPNSAASSFQMDFGIFRSGFPSGGAREASEEEENENALARKKLRLSKEQSAFLEESFKEHNTLNPKQKLALAKQLQLRPRQVEVWFQNRRARTKLKQTEVDCEYLKRCCETLTEENRRLHKELQELRALKSSNSNPFLMQLPATTLTMCPSCERVASTSGAGAGTEKGGGVIKPVTRPMFFPFSSRSTSQQGKSSSLAS